MDTIKSTITEENIGREHNIFYCQVQNVQPSYCIVAKKSDLFYVVLELHDRTGCEDVIDCLFMKVTFACGLSVKPYLKSLTFDPLVDDRNLLHS